MQTRRPHSTPLWGMQEFGHSHSHKTHSPTQLSQVPPLRHPDQALHRQMLVGELFAHVKEIRRLDNGYAFRFERSDDLDTLLGRMAEYIVFESLNSPRLIFTIDEEPKTASFWLQVQNSEDTKRGCSVIEIPTCCMPKRKERIS